jgi:hypothetical protein
MWVINLSLSDLLDYQYGSIINSVYDISSSELMSHCNLYILFSHFQEEGSIEHANQDFEHVNFNVQNQDGTDHWQPYIVQSRMSCRNPASLLKTCQYCSGY